VSNLLTGLLGALLVTNQPAGVSNSLGQRVEPIVVSADPKDPAEKEYRQIMEADDAAQEEVDKWIQEDQKFSEKGESLGSATLRPRIMQRLDPIRKRYEDFLMRYPGHVNARIAFGSFLNDLGEEDAACEQWLKAREINPSQPAVWNNLGNYYGHNGQARKAFECYDKAIELSPKESVYYHNQATTLYLFRKDAMEHYGLTPSQHYERVMGAYRKALALDPENFPLATDVAQTYYGLKPASTNESSGAGATLQAHYEAALVAWRAALKLARDEVEREGVYVHLARVNIMAGHLEEARRHLKLITNGMYATVRQRLEKKIENPGASSPVDP
jgi:tetratricopeptide (TPR) repeat protein